MGRNCLVLALLAGFTVAMLGCTGETKLGGTAPGGGTLKMDSAPLEGAQVTFVPIGQTQGRPASGQTDAAGHFTPQTLTANDGALPGDYEVKVTKTEMVGKTYTQEETAEYYKKNMKSPPSPQVKQLLPEKYGDIKTSGLKFTVKKGEKNDFNIDLQK